MKNKKIVTLFIMIFMLIVLNVLIPKTVEATNNWETSAFSCEYVSASDLMPYALVTSSNADKLEDVPLIVWLHGDGEIFKSGDTLCESGFIKVLKDWKREEFEAYVLCPHITSGWCDYSNWGDSTLQNNLKNLIENFLDTHSNVDRDNVVLVGHSGGGKGALQVGSSFAEYKYFSKIIALSAVNVPNMDKITVPTLCICRRR